MLLRVFKGDGRGDDDQREVVVSETLRAKLAGLRAWKQAERERLAHDAPLFVSQRGLRLSTRQLRHAFGIRQVRAGSERHVVAGGGGRLLEPAPRGGSVQLAVPPPILRGGRDLGSERC